NNALRNSSVVGVVSLSIPALLMIYAFSRDAASVSSPLMKQFGFMIWLISIPLTFLGIGGPALWVVWLFTKRGDHLNNCDSPRPIRVADWLVRYVGMLMFAGALIGLYYMMERFIPFSVIPFSAGFCGLLWILAACYMVRRSGTRATTKAI